MESGPDSVTHCDLAESGQPHGESGRHEVLEGEVQALLVEAQRAVQRLLHRAPHQVGHVTRGALPQLLVGQLTQVPEDRVRQSLIPAPCPHVHQSPTGPPHLYLSIRSRLSLFLVVHMLTLAFTILFF